MLSHLSIGVRDLERAVRFYDAALGALGYARVWSNARGAGYGPRGGNDKLALFVRPDAAPPAAGFHLAFAAETPAAVHRFYAAALAVGGICDGAPALRPHYGVSYYAAFVLDPDGHRLEAVHQ